MRGSVWVELEIWIVAVNRGRYKNSTGTEYGFSKTQELNSRFQREYAFQSATNQALKKYRNSHRIGSDTEINYQLVGSGINTTTKQNGYTSNKWKSTRISASRKRAIHQEVYLGKDKVLTRGQMKQNEITEQEYSKLSKKDKKTRSVRTLETNKYIIDTGTTKKKSKQKSSKSK